MLKLITNNFQKIKIMYSILESIEDPINRISKFR
jgi:hypothetical protein